MLSQTCPSLQNAVSSPVQPPQHGLEFYYLHHVSKWVRPHSGRIFWHGDVGSFCATQWRVTFRTPTREEWECSNERGSWPCPLTHTAHWIFCLSAFQMRLRSSSALRFCCAVPLYHYSRVYRPGNLIVGLWSKSGPLEFSVRTATKVTLLHLSLEIICTIHRCAQASHYEYVWGEWRKESSTREI